MGLFNLIFTLGANRKPLQDELNRAKGDVSTFGNGVKGILSRAFVPAAVAAYAKTIIDAAGRLNDLSVRLGVSTDALQEMDYAAKQNGSTMEDFISVLQRLSIARREALENPSGPQASAFGKFGLGIKEIKNARLDWILSQIADKMEEVGDAQLFMADALELMGRSAGEVLPTLINGFNKTKEAARDAGQVISEEAVKAMDEWGDKASKSWNTVKTISGEVVGYFANVHNQLAALVDAGIATVKAPFVENGILEAKAAWGRWENMENEAAGRKPMVFRMGDMGGMNGGRAVAREAEWVGPMLPPGWGEPAPKFTKPWIPNSRPSDSLVSVGNFLGGDPTKLSQQMMKISNDIKAIKDNTKKTADGALVIRK